MSKFKSRGEKEAAAIQETLKRSVSKPAKQSPIQAAREDRRIVTGWNEEQIAHLEAKTGIEILDSTSLKKAIRVILPELPEDKTAGAPTGNKNSRRRKA